MTTPGGVTNLPQGALTLDNLTAMLEDMSPTAMRTRAVERFPAIFNNSTGLNPAEDWTPFGILTAIWAQANSLIATADPADIQGPDDLPPLLLEFIEGLPIVGELVGLLEAILGTYDGEDTTLLTVQEIFAPIRKLAQLVAGIDEGFPTLEEITTGWGSLPGTELIDLLVNGGQPVNVANLFGQIPRSLFGQIPASAISAAAPNQLGNGGFTGAISMVQSGGWTYDSTVGHTSPGSAKVTGNSTVHALTSNAVEDLQPGDPLLVSVWVKTDTYVGTGTPIRLGLRTYEGTTQVSTPTIASVGGVGATWTQLSGTYTVPAAGIDAVRMRLVVDSGATAGTIWFDDASITRVGSGPFDGVLDLFGLSSLNDLFAGQLEPADVWADLITGRINPLGLVRDQNLTDGLFQVMTGVTQSNVLLADVLTALNSIPASIVGGVAGPADIGSSVLGFINAFVGGSVGVLGSGASISDVFNMQNWVSGGAFLGRGAFDLLGERANKPLGSDMLPSSVSPIEMPWQGASAPTVPITATSALTLWHRFQESMSLGVIRFQGNITGTITDMRVAIKQMNPATGDVTLTHESANIIADVSVPQGVNTYLIPTPIAVSARDVRGAEVSVRAGSGTFNIVGSPTWMTNDTHVFPRRMSTTRNPGGVAHPSTIAAGSVVYASNVPAIAFAVDTGVGVEYHEPLLVPFTVSGSYLIPSWASIVQPVVVGGGGGGAGGSQTFGLNGRRGLAGAWATATWVRGTDFTGSPTVTVSVFSGGGGGGYLIAGSSGAPGGDCSASIPGHTVIGAGGAPGSGVAGTNPGQSPGDQIYDGETYSGGGTQFAVGGAGNPPGGGGAGGGYFSNGGAGARGQVWLRFKQ